MEISYKEKLKYAFNDFKSIKTIYKQIPNMLTASRIIAPLIIIPLAVTGNMVGCIIAASLFASTDFFDGFIAQKLNITSELGRELDAVSDKVFASSLIIPLIALNPYYIINIFLECIIGSSNLRAKLKNTNPKTIFIGKVKTFALSTSIILGYLSYFVNLSNILINSLFIISTLLQITTATAYIVKNTKAEIKINNEKKIQHHSEIKNENEKKEKILNNITYFRTNEKAKVKTLVYKKKNHF